MHFPFQVLDASAIEGIRGLAGESSSICRYIRPLPPLPPPNQAGLVRDVLEERIGDGIKWSVR